MTTAIIAGAIEVHRTLGPGLLESVYRRSLAYELTQSGLDVKQEVVLPVVYKDVRFDLGFRMDLLVEDRIVEVKCVERLLPLHTAQALTYLRLSQLRVGLLLNFWSVRMIDGIKRVSR